MSKEDLGKCNRVGIRKMRYYVNYILRTNPNLLTVIKDLFKIHLFCWEWKFFIENTINKDKN